MAFAIFLTTLAPSRTKVNGSKGACAPGAPGTSRLEQQLSLRKRTLGLVAAIASCCIVASTTDARAQDTHVVVTGQPAEQASPAAPPPGYVLVYPPSYASPGAAPQDEQTQPSYRRRHVRPKIKDWSEGEAIPPGYHPKAQARIGLVVGGAVLFGITYLISALAVPLATTALYVPGVGPFIQLSQSGNIPTSSFLLVLDGLCQVGGISMFAIGLAVPKSVLVRNDVASNPLRLTIAPILGPDRSGMGLVGTF
jgi:hypothetical protein